MRVVIVGGTGRIGRLAVERSMAAGHEVTSVSGRPSSVPGVTSVVADIRDAAAIRTAVASAGTIIAAVGPRANTEAEELALEEGMRNLVAAASEHGIRRIVALSGAGVDVPDDHKPVIDRLVSAIVQRAANTSWAASSASMRSSPDRTSCGPRCGGLS